MFSTEQFMQTAQAIGDSLIETLGGWLDQGFGALKEKGGELLGGLGSGISNGFSSIKSGIGDSFSPTSLERSKPDISPSMQRSSEISAPSTPSRAQEYGDLLKSSGFSTESLNLTGFQATDMGAASVGDYGIGCASSTGPRAMATSSQMR